MQNEIIKLVKELYKIRNKLQVIASRWSFTLDGNLVGDIGEALACYHFDLKPLAKGVKTHDAKDNKERLIQIKTTQNNTVGLGLEKRDFDYLIVVKIDKNGRYDFIYNGTGKLVWAHTRSLGIGIKKLIKLNQTVKEKDRIKQVIK
jgi:hypothetical protein